MSGALDSSLRGLNDCGCCAGLEVETPATVSNRPGLSAIAYRIGTHAQFKASLLTALSDKRWPVLRNLNTRDDDDFTIALLDAWAAVSDVLTFYQERIANESYLRTARERLSLLELARLIGYQLRPGVAASAYLTFTLEEAAGSPQELTIEPGTKAQSVPGPGEQPQIFETVEEITARRAWNALKPRASQPVSLGMGAQHLHLQGTATQLQPGDAILIVGDERSSHPTTYPDRERWDFRILQTVELDTARDLTRVSWKKGLGEPPIPPAAKNVKVYALRQRAALFGHNAPDPRVLSTNGSQLSSMIDGSVWKNYAIQNNVIELDAAYPKIVVDSWVVLLTNEPPPRRPGLAGYAELYKAASVATPSLTKFAISGKATSITPDTTENLSLFGLRNTTVFAQSEPLTLAEEPITAPVSGAEIVLSSVANDLTKGRKVMVTGKRMRLRLLAPASARAEDESVVPLDSGEELIILATPKSAGGKQKEYRLLRADGTRVTLTAAPGSAAEEIASAEGDPEISDLAELSAVAPEDAEHTKLSLAEALENYFDRPTVSISANVALATHGETVQEILGSGDATVPYQKFTLRQTPLTYVSSDEPTGATSSLAVRVNDLKWTEVPTLFNRKSGERVFVTQRADDGKVTVQAGDGVNGARFSSGTENIVAIYRKGIGLAGLVKAGQLGTLLSRPLGLKAVTNPRPATGAQDPESRDDARQNAPLGVLTLGRAVSLRDYEDFSRAFSGIAKALATWTWSGQTRGVFITVSGADGKEIKKGDTVFDNLVAALRKSSDPFVQLTVKSYRPALFRLSAKLKISEEHVEDIVLAEVDSMLRDVFSFKSRAFGQPVYASEVIALIQAVPGVLAVDLDTLYRNGETPGANQPAERLLAGLPALSHAGEPLGAELLTLDPAHHQFLEIMS